MKIMSDLVKVVENTKKISLRDLMQKTNNEYSKDVYGQFFIWAKFSPTIVVHEKPKSLIFESIRNPERIIQRVNENLDELLRLAKKTSKENVIDDSDEKHNELLERLLNFHNLIFLNDMSPTYALLQQQGKLYPEIEERFQKLCFINMLTFETYKKINPDLIEDFYKIVEIKHPMQAWEKPSKKEHFGK